MNIIEAVKTGKKFRRTDRSGEWIINGPSYIFHIDHSDIISDDWEVEIKKVEVTREDLKNAINCLNVYGINNATQYRALVDGIARKLGL